MAQEPPRMAQEAPSDPPRSPRKLVKTDPRSSKIDPSRLRAAKSGLRLAQELPRNMQLTKFPACICKTYKILISSTKMRGRRMLTNFHKIAQHASPLHFCGRNHIFYIDSSMRAKVHQQRPSSVPERPKNSQERPQEPPGAPQEQPRAAHERPKSSWAVLS